MNKQIIIILLTAIVIGSVSCDKKKKKFKDADAVFENITKVYTLNKDGSIDYHYKHKLNLRSYYSFNRLYGETFIVYNPEYQELNINKSVTETAEGNKVPSPENAFNKVLPRFAEGAPPYSHLREMVVTHTGLEKNSTINLDYELKSNKDFKPFLMENELLAKRSPIRKLTIKVRFPEDKKLNYKLLNAKEKLNISEEGDFKEYKWVFNNVSPVSHEHKQPEYKQHLPRLIFSTENFNKAYSYFTDQLSSELPGLINERLTNILKDKTSEIDTILAVQDMVVNHFNHFNIPLEHTGFRMKSNKNVLNNNGGTGIEKTNLLSSILNKLNIDAEVVGIIPSEFYGEQTGNLKIFQELYVKAKSNDEVLYLSAIHNNTFNPKHKYADATNVIINDNYDEPKFIEPSKNTNSIFVKGDFQLSQNNLLTGSIEHRRTYCENPYYNISKSKENINNLLSPGFSTKDIKKHTTVNQDNNKVRVNYEISKKINPKEQGDYLLMDIPMVHSGLMNNKLARLASDRESPLEINWPLKVVYNYTIELPENLELRNESTDISKSSENEKVDIQIREKGGKIHIKRHLEIKDNYIKPGSYSTFKDAINIWQKPNYKTLVLKRAD